MRCGMPSSPASSQGLDTSLPHHDRYPLPGVCGAPGPRSGRACATLRRMTLDTILDYLNAVPVRATYGAVGDVLGVRPQVVPRLLGARRPEASWIVNGTTGEPTGYTPDQVDPRLAGTHVIRSGDELRRSMEGPAAAEADDTSTADAAAGHEVLETTASTSSASSRPTADAAAGHEVLEAAAGGHEAPAGASGGRETPEMEVMAMGGDAKWIIGTLVPVVLLVTGLLSAQIASVSGSLTTRIDDVNDRIDDLTAQIAGVNTGIDEVRDELEGEIAALRADLSSIAADLRAGRPAPGLTEPEGPSAPDAGEETADAAAPAPDEGGEAVEPAPDAPEGSPDPQAEPATDPAPANPDPPRE